MSSEMYEHMRSNPKFVKLVTKRGRFAWTLAFIVLGMFYGFVLLVAFKPALLGRPIYQGSMVTIGVAFELFMFIFFWLLTAFYVKRANSEFDAMTREVVNQAWQEGQ